jgi:hypothetical protein
MVILQAVRAPSPWLQFFMSILITPPEGYQSKRVLGSCGLISQAMIRQFQKITKNDLDDLSKCYML